MTELNTEIHFVAVHSAEHIAQIAELARNIWVEHYTPIIGAAQVEYMLANFQTERAIAQQLAEGYEYFLVGGPATNTPGATLNWLGYCAAQSQVTTRRLFISKLYVTAAARGQGVGRTILEYLSQLARLRGLSTLWLTVNKYNPALQHYLHWGFVNVAAIVADIGGGYVMDDFKLEKQVL